MDPKKPSPESPEERVDALVRRRSRETGKRGDDTTRPSDRDAASPGSPPVDEQQDTKRRPQLTEKQRVEARRRRAEQRRRGRTASPRGSNPLSKGVRATGTELKRTAIFLAGAVVAGLDRFGPVGRALRSGLAELLRTIGRGLTALWRTTGIGLSRLGALVQAADRLVTPRSATIAVAGTGVLALVVSQFLDFRAIEIGQQGYQAVQEITDAPRRDLMTPIGAHSVLLIAVGLLALAAVIGAATTGRRRFGLVIAACGLAVVAVGVVVDLPQGLDVAEAEISYTGVSAVLLTGFWLQLAAGATLTITGLGLAATSARPAPDPAGSDRPRPPRPERRRRPSAGSPA